MKKGPARSRRVFFIGGIEEAFLVGLVSQEGSIINICLNTEWGAINLKMIGLFWNVPD